MQSIDRKLQRLAREIEEAKPKGLSVAAFNKGNHPRPDGSIQFDMPRRYTVIGVDKAKGPDQAAVVTLQATPPKPGDKFKVVHPDGQYGGQVATFIRYVRREGLGDYFVCSCGHNFGAPVPEVHFPVHWLEPIPAEPKAPEKVELVVGRVYLVQVRDDRGPIFFKRAECGWFMGAGCSARIASQRDEVWWKDEECISWEVLREATEAELLA